MNPNKQTNTDTERQHFDTERQNKDLLHRRVGRRKNGQICNERERDTNTSTKKS